LQALELVLLLWLACLLLQQLLVVLRAAAVISTRCLHSCIQQGVAGFINGQCYTYTPPTTRET
jgi:hypothetical protein